MKDAMLELIEKRQQNSKTFDLGNGKRQLVISIGDVHYKDNYANPSEQWKDIDLTWEGNRITKAPYELTLDGKKLTLKDKRTGKVSTLELLDAKPVGLKFEIIPFTESASFRHTLPSDKIPFEAQFRVTGNFRTRAFDDAGELELETSFRDGILIEKLSQVKDKETGQVRAAVGNIRVDPTLTVQPSGKDTFLIENEADTNFEPSETLYLSDKVDVTTRTILEFDISELPGGQTLTAASLDIWYKSFAWNDPVGKTVWAYKQIHIDWVEAEATWNIYKTGSNWTAPGGDWVEANPDGGSTVFPAGAAWMSWNVLDIVQDAYDGSIAAEFLVKFATEGLGSGESQPQLRSNTDPLGEGVLRPKLVIDYTPEAPPAGLENKSANMGSKMVAAGIL